MTELVEMLRIRCTKKLLTDFKHYAVPFDTYNNALVALLEDSKRLDVVRREKIRS